MNKGSYAINNLDIDVFLREYWQQKPLLIRAAMPDFDNPLSPDELAGLACEPDVESRIVSQRGQDWQLQLGPFDEGTFAQLPEHDWTLLVQAVDHIVPEAAELLNYFRFIPNWRLDDVMASYATTGGSVGPHYDNYDVFLLQGAGQRHWRVGAPFAPGDTLLPHDQLRLIENFQGQQEWTLEPGDMLYLPPLYSHWGVALSDDCMTYSVGFRAPSQGEMLSDFCDHQIQKLSDEQRYSDANLPRQNNPGEISPQAIAAVQQIIAAQLTDSEAIREWFGRYMTEVKYPLDEQPQPTDEHWQQQLNDAEAVYRDPASRFSFSGSGQRVSAFVNGTLHRNISRELIELLCSAQHFSAVQINALADGHDDNTLLQVLLAQGSLILDHELFD